MYFCNVVIISKCKKVWAFHLNKLESPSPKDALCHVWLKFYLPLEKNGPSIWTNLNSLHPKMICVKFGWNWPSGSGEEFLNLSMYFRNFVIISHWKKERIFIWTNLNTIHLRMINAKFGWIWPNGSGEDDF